MKTSAKQHLEWLYQRLIVVHGENPQYDYMLDMKAIIDGTYPVTPATAEDVIQKLDEDVPHPDDEEGWDEWLNEMGRMAEEAGLSQGEPPKQSKKEDDNAQ